MKSTIFVLMTLLVTLTVVLVGCTTDLAPPVNDSNTDSSLNQSVQDLNALVSEGDLTIPSDLDTNDLEGIENSISESDLN